LLKNLNLKVEKKVLKKKNPNLYPVKTADSFIKKQKFFILFFKPFLEIFQFETDEKTIILIQN
jgi:hypothetical protein